MNEGLLSGAKFNQSRQVASLTSRTRDLDVTYAKTRNLTCSLGTAAEDGMAREKRTRRH